MPRAGFPVGVWSRGACLPLVPPSRVVRIDGVTRRSSAPALRMAPGDWPAIVHALTRPPHRPGGFSMRLPVEAVAWTTDDWPSGSVAAPSRECEAWEP